MWPGSLDFGTCSLPKFPERLTSSCPGRQSVSPHCNHRPTLSHLLFCTNSKTRKCLLQRWGYKEGRPLREDSSTFSSWNIWAWLSDKKEGLLSLLPALALLDCTRGTWLLVTAPANRSLLQKSCRVAVFHRITPFRPTENPEQIQCSNKELLQGRRPIFHDFSPVFLKHDRTRTQAYPLQTTSDLLL